MAAKPFVGPGSPTNPIACFEDRDVESRGFELAGGDQAGEAGTDHDDGAARGVWVS
jgi:hypothetical protein